MDFSPLVIYLLKFGLAVAVGEGIRKKDNPDELSLLVAERGLEPLTSGL